MEQAVWLEGQVTFIGEVHDQIRLVKRMSSLTRPWLIEPSSRADSNLLKRVLWKPEDLGMEAL
eukprot:3746807-Amphidinium_carterae.1